LLKKQATISASNNNDDQAFSRKKKRGSGKPPLLWFTTSTLPTNTYLGIYRSIFTNAEQENEALILDTIKAKQLAPKPQLKSQPSSNNGLSLPEAYKGPHIFLCMIGGGHFAAMVVSLAPKQTKSASTGPLSREATVLAHKTFHRYTTRRKQGGAQSANDSAKGAAHSAGSSLRRYNEQALTDEVRLLLQDWKAMIDTSELLFIRATGTTNRRTLFGPYEGQILRQNDSRIRGFPFSTRRATQNELMRSFVELTRVKVLEVDEAAIAAAKAAAEEEAIQSAASKKSKPTTPTPPKRSEEEDTAALHTNQIQALIRRSKLPALLSYLKSNDLSPDFVFYPPDAQQNHHTPRPLHLAASQNSPPLVSGLLIKAGAAPTILNGDGKTPFDLTGDRATRDAFRVARAELGESKFDWSAAHVPNPISREEAEERDTREKKEEALKEQERRQTEAARLKEEGPKVLDSGPLGKAAGRGRALALGQVQKTAQEKREDEARGMTPEMRTRLEREKRARAAEERMKGGMPRS
jgi:Bacteroidetes VLRF1 release factor